MASMDVIEVVARLEGRIARLETVLREMGKLAMEDAMSDKGFRHYVHTEAGFALEAEHEARD